MPVDQAVLQQLVDEIPFAKAEDKTYFLNSLKADDAAATQFVGQRLRHSDYTKKTTDLTAQKKQLDGQYQQLTTELAQAQAQQRKIMSDLEAKTISEATANARLQKVKSVYNLSDDDIPPVEDMSAAQRRAAADHGTIDVKGELEKFKADLLKTIGREFNQMPQVTAILSEIDHQHIELTGKRLTAEQRNELLAKAREEGSGGLMSVWEREHKIGDIRTGKMKESWEKELRTKWDDEQKARNSEAAMRGVRPNQQDQNWQSNSPVMNKKFKQHEQTPGQEAQRPAPAQQPAQQPVRQEAPRLRGAEAAAAKFLERRANNIPMGKEAPVGSGG